MKSDKEILKAIKISVTKNLITLKFSDDVTNKKDNERLSELILGKLDVICKKNINKKFNLLIDLTSSKEATTISRKARKNYAKISKFKQLNKTAAVGHHIVLKTVSTFIAKLTGREKDYKWFDNKKEALEWLKK
jgi:hypothetical protein